MQRRTLLMPAGLLAVAALAGAAMLTPAIVDPAIAIQTALAKDSMTNVTANAAAIAEEANKLQPSAPKVVAAAKELQKATKIADARTAFGNLNEALVAYMDANKLSADPSTRIAYCPMVRKPWLQKDGAINNPYFGSQMLGCGEFRK
jgi:hypothetical protein